MTKHEDAINDLKDAQTKVSEYKNKLEANKTIYVAYKAGEGNPVNNPEGKEEIEDSDQQYKSTRAILTKKLKAAEAQVSEYQKVVDSLNKNNKTGKTVVKKEENQSPTAPPQKKETSTKRTAGEDLYTLPSKKTAKDIKENAFEAWINNIDDPIVDKKHVSTLIRDNLASAYATAIDGSAIPPPEINRSEKALFAKHRIIYDYLNGQYICMKSEFNKYRYTIIEHLVPIVNRELGSLEAVGIKPWTPVMNDYQIHPNIKKEMVDYCIEFKKKTSRGALDEVLKALNAMK